MALALLRRFVAGYAARVLGRDTEAAEEADEGDAEAEDASGDDAHLGLDARVKRNSEAVAGGVVDLIKPLYYNRLDNRHG